MAFDDVRFVYPDGRVGLAGLSFDAAPGTTVALVGPSGAGKSTALALIPRLHDVAAGAVRIDGADVREVTLASLRDAIAYVGQDALLFDDTVAANIRMGRPGCHRRRGGGRRGRGGRRRTSSPPCRRATPPGSGPGGAAPVRRAAPARRRSPAPCCAIRASCCWTRRPARSTPRTRPRCRTALARLRRGRTTIVVAHRLSTVRDADLVVVMAGRPRGGTRHARRSCWRGDGLYARLVRSQMLAA